MGKCFLYGNGDGNPLRFDVIDGTEEPTNPKEDTIWVNTSTPITDWIFSSTQPKTSPGRVWFCTGTSSVAKFNALKKNQIQVYPLYAKQCVSDAWQNVTAKSYQNGAWIEWWDGTILAGANQYESFTGGWQTAEGIGTAAAITATGINFTRFVVDNDGTSWAYAITKKKIDLTPYSTLAFDCKADSSGYGTEIGVSMTNSGTGDLLAKVVPTAYSEAQRFTLDISNIDGEVYIVARSKKHAATYNNIKLYVAEQAQIADMENALRILLGGA